MIPTIFYYHHYILCCNPTEVDLSTVLWSKIKTPTTRDPCALPEIHVLHQRSMCSFQISVCSTRDHCAPPKIWVLFFSKSFIKFIKCYGLGCQRPMMELLSPMAVMLEGLGFNLCVAPFLNICVPNLPQGHRWRMSEVVGVGSEVPYTRQAKRG